MTRLPSTDGLPTRSRKIALSLPMPPSVNNMFANRAGGGRIKAEKYRAWTTEAGWELLRQKPGQIEGRFAIDVSITRPARKGKCDLDNRLKPLLDLLKTHRVIVDDSLAERITLAWADDGVGVRITLEAA